MNVKKLNWEKIALRLLLKSQKYYFCKVLLGMIIRDFVTLNGFFPLSTPHPQPSINGQWDNVNLDRLPTKIK